MSTLKDDHSRAGPAPAGMLVVGDDELAERLARHGGQSVVCVDDYLCALGEMADGGPGLVVGRLAPMARSLEPTVRALRTLGPGARLVLVVDACDEPAAMRAVRLGFDDYLVLPVDDEQLADVAANGGTASRRSVQPPWPPMTEGQRSGDDPLAALAEAETGLDADIDQFLVMAEVPAEVAQSPRPPRAADEPLGDVDLVEQLLFDRRGLRDLALQLIAQRLDDPELSWSATPVEDSGACAEVGFDAQSLGYLVAPRADAHQLGGYANWLGRWLMLEQHLERLNHLAFRDAVTGVWNRRYFDQFFPAVVERARNERFEVTLLLYDIDDFKAYNDTHGHTAGDEILSETARLIRSVVRRQDAVARIGGDEFAVIFWDPAGPRRRDSRHPEGVRACAERFQQAIREHRFPKLAEQAKDTLTISGGLASYPWDGVTSEQLYERADMMLLESKRQGKNALSFGAGAMADKDLLDRAAEWDEPQT
ncbi:MAG: diguanylate cyclase [Phycisphaerae bacterium]|nr:diguanylate cyclase [Phycisphaerae bacterium]